MRGPFPHIALVALVLGLAGLTPSRAPAADIAPLLDRAATAARSKNNEAAIAALETAIEQLRLEAPLVVKPFHLVARPAKFYGDYVPREPTLRRGEAMHFYLEPKNLVYSRAADGTYTPAFTVDFDVVDTTGKVLGGQEKFGSWRFPTKSPVQDIYMNLTVNVSGLPAGAYKVRFVVRDANSPKTATVEQAVTLK
jgi:hypothetical protein